MLIAGPAILTGSALTAKHFIRVALGISVNIAVSILTQKSKFGIGIEVSLYREK